MKLGKSKNHLLYYVPERHIHTVLSPEYKKKLIMHGNGSIKNGIEKLLKIADEKKVTVQVLTEVCINE